MNASTCRTPCIVRHVRHITSSQIGTSGLEPIEPRVNFHHSNFIQITPYLNERLFKKQSISHSPSSLSSICTRSLEIKHFSLEISRIRSCHGQSETEGYAGGVGLNADINRIQQCAILSCPVMNYISM